MCKFLQKKQKRQKHAWIEILPPDQEACAGGVDDDIFRFLVSDHFHYLYPVDDDMLDFDLLTCHSRDSGDTQMFHLDLEILNDAYVAFY